MPSHTNNFCLIHTGWAVFSMAIFAIIGYAVCYAFQVQEVQYIYISPSSLGLFSQFWLYYFVMAWSFCNVPYIRKHSPPPLPTHHHFSCTPFPLHSLLGQRESPCYPRGHRWTRSCRCPISSPLLLNSNYTRLFSTRFFSYYFDHEEQPWVSWIVYVKLVD